MDKKKKITIEFDKSEIVDLLSDLSQARNCIDRILPPAEIERKGIVELIDRLARKLKS